MKKLLFLIVGTLALFSSCNKDIDIETADYMWVKGDSIPTRNFIMSVATIYPMDTVSTKYKLECQVTLGDSTDANLFGSKMELNMIFDNVTSGTYTIGSNCSGEILYTTCRPAATDGKAEFRTDTYSLSSGTVELLSLNAQEVQMNVDLNGEVSINETMTIVPELVVTETGDSTYVDKEVWTVAKRQISLTGLMIARY